MNLSGRDNILEDNKSLCSKQDDGAELADAHVAFCPSCDVVYKLMSDVYHPCVCRAMSVCTEHWPISESLLNACNSIHGRQLGTTG